MIKEQNAGRTIEFMIDSLSRVNQLIAGILVIGMIDQKKQNILTILSGLFVYLIIFMTGIYLCSKVKKHVEY